MLVGCSDATRPAPVRDRNGDFGDSGGDSGAEPEAIPIDDEAEADPAEPKSTGVYDCVGPDEFLPVPLSFGWIELDGKSEAALEADAGGPHLELRNLGDASVHVTVRALIDHGTTGGQELELADATLGPGKGLSIAVPLDVGDKNVTEMAYAGQILPSVHAEFADGRTETVVGTPLFFHPGADAVRVYDRVTLTTKYRWGDFHGDVDDALLVDTSLDAEEGGGFVTDRVVLIESIAGPRVEPTDELEDDGA